MRIIVCGGRDFEDWHVVFAGLDLVAKNLGGIDLLIEGGQRKRRKGWLVGGVDFWANRWAVERGVPHLTVEAEWKRWGGHAGPIRNAAMLRKGVDLVVGFPGGSGTADMLDKACRARVPRVIFDEGGRIVPAAMHECK